MYHAVIIGAGNIAAGFDSPHSSHILTHAHGYQQNPLFCLRGFYDKDQTKAKQAAQIWGCRAYEALDDALKGAEVISCCVPDSYHKEVLQQAAKYHPRLVITEKPLAVSMEEARAVQRIYGGRIPLLLNYSRRFLKEFQKLRQEIRTKISGWRKPLKSLNRQFRLWSRRMFLWRNPFGYTSRGWNC